MAHQVVIAEEHYVYRTETRKKLFILLGVGVVLFILGILLAAFFGGHHEVGHGGQASIEASE